MLCALLLCVGLFSITAHAESTPNYKAYIQAYSSGFNLNSAYSFYDGSEDFINYNTQDTPITLKSQTYYMKWEVTLTDDSDYILFEGGNTYEYRLDNLFLNWSVHTTGGTKIFEIDTSKLYLQNCYMHYTDGTKENVTFKLSYNDKTGTYSLTTSVSPAKDVKSMYIEICDKMTPSSSYVGKSAFIGTVFGSNFVNLLQFKITVENKEVGLLKGLGDKISGMWNSLTEGFTKLKESTDNIVDGILGLPAKLWGLISDGLKALFVPDPDYMASYKDKWDSLLARQLGAVYQVKEILSESWDSVMNADQTNTIEFPSASINLPGGNKFTFGGYTVQVVPSGFTVLVTAIKSIIGIVCTIAFVNGMRKRYDEVMGVEQ